MVRQGSLFEDPAAKRDPARTQFLAGLIAVWRYGDKPVKAEREAAAALAAEFNSRISQLPDLRKSNPMTKEVN